MRVNKRGRELTCSGFRVQGAGFRVQGSGCRVQGAGFKVQGSGSRVQADLRERAEEHAFPRGLVERL